MLNKKIVTILSAVLLSFISGCAGMELNKDTWDNLQDRKFYFSEFIYLNTGANSEKAYDAMKDFPVKKIMYILSKQYNIEIDMSDYNAFIQNRNLAEIKAEGLIRNNKFTWSSKNINSSNRIAIVFEKDYMDESLMNFKLKTKSGGKNLKTIDIKFSRTDVIFEQLGYYFEKTNEYISEYAKNGYEEKHIVPGLILGDSVAASNSQKLSKTAEIKLMLEEHVKTLDAEQKKSFKHEIIDHMYKICE